MRICIIGAGEVGFYLANYLSDDHSVTVVDADEERVQYIEENLDVASLCGDGSSVSTLIEAEVDSCGLFLSVTNDDEVNMLAALMAKKMGVDHTVARVDRQQEILEHERFYNETLGIDQVVNPDRLASLEIAKLVREHGATKVEDYAQGRIQVRNVRVQEEAPIAGQTLHEINFPDNLLVAAVIREGELSIPSGDHEIHSGDRLLVITDRRTSTALEKLTGAPAVSPENIFIVGGGQVGASLARILSTRDTQIKLFERNTSRAWDLADELPEVQVIEGDGTDARQLQQHYIDACDTFIACSGNDEVNLMSCLLAKQHGADRTACVVHRPDYTQLGNQLGVDLTISPRLLTANEVIRFIHRGHVHHVSLVQEGEAVIVEFSAAEESVITGKKLSEMELPQGAVIGALVRDEEAVIPRGEDRVLAGDRVVMFATEENLPYIEETFAEELGSTPDHDGSAEPTPQIEAHGP